jgi:hypothetical protein
MDAATRRTLMPRSVRSKTHALAADSETVVVPSWIRVSPRL